MGEALHQGKVEKPEVPSYADSVDKTVSGQEDLVLAFTELVRTPTPRHVFSFVLAAFIDVIVFLLAFASGPYFFGAPEQQWLRAGARIEGMDDPAFLAGPKRVVQSWQGLQTCLKCVAAFGPGTTPTNPKRKRG